MLMGRVNVNLAQSSLRVIGSAPVRSSLRELLLAKSPEDRYRNVSLLALTQLSLMFVETPFRR